MTDQTGAPGPPGTPWSRPDPGSADDPRPGLPPAYEAPVGGQQIPPAAAEGWGPSTGWTLPQVPKPGIVPLRPLGLLEILDGSISAIRAHPVAMLGLSAVVVTVSTVIDSIAQYAIVGDLEALVASTSADPMDQDALFADLATVIYAMAISASISVLAQIVLAGLLTTVVYRAVLGEHIPMGAAWRAARSRLPALLALALLTGLVMLVAVAAVSFPAIVGTVFGPLGVVLTLGWVLTAAANVVVVAYLYVVLGVAGPAVVLERRGPVAACQRSRRLVRGSFWRVFGILALSGLFVFVITAAISIPFEVVSTLVGSGDPFGVGPLTVSAIGATLAGTLTSPFAAAVVVLLFVDLRVRREGLDIELARAAGLPGGSQPTAAGPGPVAGTSTQTAPTAHSWGGPGEDRPPGQSSPPRTW